MSAVTAAVRSNGTSVLIGLPERIATRALMAGLSAQEIEVHAGQTVGHRLRPGIPFPG
jgi:hypothetical protein